MHKMISVVGLVVLTSAVARAYDDDVSPEGDPIDPELTITIDVPEYRAARSHERDLPRSWEGIPHRKRVSGVVTGQRIPLPRDADGGCRLDARVGEEGFPALRMEVDPDGRHWWQHAITVVTST